MTGRPHTAGDMETALALAGFLTAIAAPLVALYLILVHVLFGVTQ